jgi:hypothetical protein
MALPDLISKLLIISEDAVVRYQMLKVKNVLRLLSFSILEIEFL